MFFAFVLSFAFAFAFAFVCAFVCAALLGSQVCRGPPSRPRKGAVTLTYRFRFFVVVPVCCLFPRCVLFVCCLCLSSPSPSLLFVPLSAPRCLGSFVPCRFSLSPLLFLAALPRAFAAFCCCCWWLFVGRLLLASLPSPVSSVASLWLLCFLAALVLALPWRGSAKATSAP